MAHRSIRGRGAAHNPANRFVPIEVVADEWIDEESPPPETQYFRDASRSIIATNDSPDVGFEASVNPYRGCSHGCSFCIDGDALVSMFDGTARRLGDIRPGDVVYGTDRNGRRPVLRPSTVLAHWSTVKPAYRITLEDGTEIVASGDHRFLTTRGWKYAHPTRGRFHARWHMRIGDRLEGIGSCTPAPLFTAEYMRGYLCGVIRGDGLLRSYHYERQGRAHGNQHQFRLVMSDDEALDRSARFLRSFGVETHTVLFQREGPRRSRLNGIRSHALGHVEKIREIVAWRSNPTPDWTGGFLAGIYDAEGSLGRARIQISNTDDIIIRETRRALSRHGFVSSVTRFRREKYCPVDVVGVLGGMPEHFRFLQAVHPAITRKRDLQGRTLPWSARRAVVFIEPVGKRRLYDITTTTEDFTVNGASAHNCYARPTHEYFGLSAGLDFETKIFVKEDAPALLRKALSSPKWEPKTIAMSGVTDAYQPVERKLKITRGCLEVLAEFRNPVGIVTKSHLVTRDADLLGELAAHDAAIVNLSITSLRNEIQRAMEPRAASPARRLEAIRKLSEAGIPTGVMVAPVVPGLTDHELPAILAAAAEAGAVRAGWIMLRLPHGVKELFEDWLERHFPDRRDKVLNRLRDLRGGELYDSSYGARMRGSGPFAEQVGRMFELGCRSAGLNRRPVRLSTAAFRRPPIGGQLGLFDSKVS